MKPHDPDTRTAIILLTVPKHWEGLDQATLSRKLLANPGFLYFIAGELKRCLDNPDQLDPKVIAERLLSGKPIGEP